jgi:hypothetical protein
MTKTSKLSVAALAAVFALGVAGAEAQTKIKSNQYGSITSLSNKNAVRGKAPVNQKIVNSKNLNSQKIVAGGAGNVVAGGAGNIVAGGAGNIVAGGAGNVKNGKIVAGGAGNIVAGGAGNVRR